MMGLLSGKYDQQSRLPLDSVRGKTLDWMVYFRDGRPPQRFLAQLAALRDLLTVGGRMLALGALGWLLARSISRQSGLR